MSSDALRCPAPRRFGRGPRLIGIGVFVALVAAAALVPSREAPAATPSSARGPDAGSAVALTAVAAVKGDLGVHLSAIGTVTPVYTSTITSQVTGIITKVHYQEGQRVKEGDPLIDLDDRMYAAQLIQAKGTLEKDQKVLAQAKMDLARYRTAWDRNAIPKQTLDDQEQIALQDEGVVKADQGTVRADETQVIYCHLRAPISGRVGLRLVDPGNLVIANSTTALVIITQETPTTVIFTIAEDNIGQVQQQLASGRTLPVEAFDRTELHRIAAGTLLTLDNQIDTTTGTVKLRALFENQDDRLFPNQFVNARLLVETKTGLTLIPSATIQHNGQESFVYVVANDTIQRRPVTPGLTDSGMTSVDGVKPGELVASSSFEKLRSEVRVSVVKGDASVDGGAGAADGGEQRSGANDAGTP